MTTPSQDLLQLLVNAGFPSNILFWGQRPDEPSRCIMLRESGASASAWTQSDGEIVKPVLDVLVRNTTGDGVWTDALNAHSALRGYNLTLGGNLYQAIRPVSYPIDGGRDARNRREVSFLLEVWRGNG